MKMKGCIDMENVNMSELMKLLSKMDKKELENGLSQASKILHSHKADEIIEQIKNGQSN